MSTPDFVSIDFETASQQRASPIQVGVVMVLDGQLGDPFTLAIMPPEGYRRFAPEIVAVHGLGPESIVGAPEWADVLGRIDRFTTAAGRGRLPLVAHNATFERSVISKTSEVLGLTAPAFDYRCTLRMARAHDRTSPNHRLDTLAQRYGLGQSRHHDAGDDALVGARLALHLLGGGANWTNARLPAPR